MDGGGDVHQVPMRIINRPLQSTVNEGKVKSLCETIETNPELVPPVTVLWVKGSEGGNYYYAFGGCHRYEAHKRLGKEFISAIVQKISIGDLSSMMGMSAPKDLK